MGGYTIEDLTVNICTVNRPEYLGACLESLLHTTPEGAPLTIVFNGTPSTSRERTMEQAGAWKGPVHFEHIPEMVSLDASHNRALELVKTPLVNFMGDDDVALAPRFEKILQAFNQTDPEPAAVTTFARRIAGDATQPTIGTRKNLGPTSVPEWKRWRDEGFIFEMLWPGAVLRTDVLRKSGGFEAKFNQSVDNRIFTKLAIEAPVIALPDWDFGYRIHQGSVSTSNWKLQNEHVRLVEACHRARRQNLPEPSLEDLLKTEAADPSWIRAKRDLRDRSRMYFRRGGALALGGQRVQGFGNLAVSGLLWPPAFFDKLTDQFKNKSVAAKV